MQSGVEGAYLEWLVFGDKENVELHKSRLDTSSPGPIATGSKVLSAVIWLHIPG